MKKTILRHLPLGAVILSFLIASCSSLPPYQYKKEKLPESFEAFYSQKLEASKKLKARPGNEERLVRFAPGKTPLAILYIHGFGASRADGEFVVDKIAKQFRANTYYLRLPGQGTNMEDQAKATRDDYLREAVTALMMMEKLGDNVIVIGTSMGGLLATYLAAEYPDKMKAVILASPFYNFASTAGRMLHCGLFFKLMTKIMPVRVDTSPVPPEKDNWTLYWYKEEYLSAFRSVLDLTESYAREEVYTKVSVPVLMLYYYRDKEHQDRTAQVSSMREAFPLFGKAGKPNPLNREINIVNGTHVLLSKYEKSDWDTATREIGRFIGDVIK